MWDFNSLFQLFFQGTRPSFTPPEHLWVSYVTSFWALGILVCPVNASRMVSMTGSSSEIAKKAQSLKRPWQFCFSNFSSFPLLFWAFSTAWNVELFAKRATGGTCSRIFPCNELKSGVTKCLHLSDGLTLTAPFLENKIS